MRVLKRIILLAFCGILLLLVDIKHTNAEEWTGKMTPASATISVGGTTTVHAAQTSSIKVSTLPTYTSSDETIATVDSTGKVTGIKAGSVTITGKFGDLVAGKTTVTVTGSGAATDEWTGKMTPASATISVGGTTTVHAAQTSSIKVSTLPTYTSSDETIATVDSTGKVTGIKAGSVTITGKFGNLTAGTTTVTVKDSKSTTGTENPKTGFILLKILFLLLSFSVGIIVYYMKKSSFNNF